MASWYTETCTVINIMNSQDLIVYFIYVENWLGAIIHASWNISSDLRFWVEHWCHLISLFIKIYFKKDNQNYVFSIYMFIHVYKQILKRLRNLLILLWLNKLIIYYLKWEWNGHKFNTYKLHNSKIIARKMCELSNDLLCNKK